MIIQEAASVSVSIIASIVPDNTQMIQPTSLASVPVFLFSGPCVAPLTGAWWPGSPGTRTLLLALTIGVFTWNDTNKKFTWQFDDCNHFTLWEYSGKRVIFVTLETVDAIERDRLVWTSRVKQMHLSAVSISCTDENEEERFTSAADTTSSSMQHIYRCFGFLFFNTLTPKCDISALVPDTQPLRSDWSLNKYSCKRAQRHKTWPFMQICNCVHSHHFLHDGLQVVSIGQHQSLHICSQGSCQQRDRHRGVFRVRHLNRTWRF